MRTFIVAMCVYIMSFLETPEPGFITFVVFCIGVALSFTQDVQEIMSGGSNE